MRLASCEAGIIAVVTVNSYSSHYAIAAVFSILSVSQRAHPAKSDRGGISATVARTGFRDGV